MKYLPSFLSSGIALMTLISSLVLSAQDTVDSDATFDDLTSGVHYDFTANEVKFNPRAKVEVVEAFSYSCPHCATLEGLIPAWKKTLPKGVSFTKIPVQWRPKFLATLYWTLVSMNKEKQMTPRVFRAISSRNNLTSYSRSQTFLRQNGINVGAFAKHMDSFFVKNAMRRSSDTLRKWSIRSTPTMIVDGKYKVPGSSGNRMTYQDILTVTNIIAAHQLENAE